MIKTTAEQSMASQLVEQGIITRDQLAELNSRKNKSAKPFIDVLFDSGFLPDEPAALSILADYGCVDYISLKDLNIEQEIVRKVPAKYAIHYKMMPFALTGDTISIALNRRDDLPLTDEISLVLQTRIKVYFATDRDITEAIRKYYGVGAETIDEMMGQIQKIKGCMDSFV